jgi:hypothetical protein
MKAKTSAAPHPAFGHPLPALLKLRSSSKASQGGLVRLNLMMRGLKGRGKKPTAPTPARDSHHFSLKAQLQDPARRGEG